MFSKNMVDDMCMCTGFWFGRVLFWRLHRFWRFDAEEVEAGGDDCFDGLGEGEAIGARGVGVGLDYRKFVIEGVEKFGEFVEVGAEDVGAIFVGGAIDDFGKSDEQARELFFVRVLVVGGGGVGAVADNVEERKLICDGFERREAHFCRFLEDT